jgi:hypothetical protein
MGLTTFAAALVPTYASRMRKKQFGENEPGDGAVEEKIIPLDRGPDGGSNDGAAKLDLMFARAEGGGLGIEGCHARLFSGGVPQKPL